MGLVRRFLLVLLASTMLAGCGFKLRNSQELPFASIAVTPEKGKGVAGEMARILGGMLRPVAPAAGAEPPEVILDILEESRERLAVGLNASGQVREYELRMRVDFKLRSFKGTELVAPSFIEQHRSISFSESAVLAKETEEALLYGDMQNDIAQQLMRRLSAVKLAGAASKPTPAAQ